MTIVTEHGNGSGAAAAPGQLRLLFFVRSIHYDRVLENFLRAVLERGHELHVALALEKRGLGAEKTKIFDDLSSRYPFSYERLPEPHRSVADPGSRPQARARLPALPRARVRERTSIARARPGARAASTPWILKIPPFRGRRGRRFVAATLRGIEAAIPVPRRSPL